MKITPLGCGSAFTMKDFQSNLLIERNGKKLLIDAGTDIRFSLEKQGLSYKDIDALYITHLHADHIGGGEYLMFNSYFDPTKDKINLIGHKSVLDLAWKSWEPGASSIQGKVMDLYDYWDVSPLRDNGSFFWEGIHFDIVQSVHIMNGYSIVPSFGLMIHHPDNMMKIYFTSDAQFNPNQIKDFYNQADLVIQDCETSPFMSGVHAHYTELKTLDIKFKNKMWLTHYQDNVLNDFEKINEEARNDGFIGFCKTGQDVLDLGNTII